jgi:hypothetical protein
MQIALIFSDSSNRFNTRVVRHMSCYRSNRLFETRCGAAPHNNHHVGIRTVSTGAQRLPVVGVHPAVRGILRTQNNAAVEVVGDDGGNLMQRSASIKM